MALGYPNQNGGRTTDVALFHAIGNIFIGSSVSGFKVRQGSPLGMSVRIGGESNIPDDLLIKDASGATFPVCNLSTQSVVATVATANSANPRIDSVVVYIDAAVSASQTSANNQNRTKIAVVAGVPATNPSAPSASQIKAAVGSNSPYVVLADIRVNRGVTSISDTNITDRREIVRLNHAPVISDSTQLADDIVLPRHIASATYSTSEKQVGTWIDGKPLYRKTITTASISRGDNFFPLDLDDSANVIHMYGGASSISRIMPLPYPHVDGGWSVEVSYDRSRKAARIKVTDNTSITSAWLTVEYTRS